MKRITRISLGLMAVAVLVAPVGASASEVINGLFKVKTTVMIDGMSEKELEAITQTEEKCYTERHLVPDMTKPSKDCVGSAKKSGNITLWTVSCKKKDNGSTKVEAETMYTKDKFKTVMKTTTISGNGKQTKNVLREVGDKIGECKKQ